LVIDRETTRLLEVQQGAGVLTSSMILPSLEAQPILRLASFCPSYHP
jgi:hypothetical protein